MFRIAAALLALFLIVPLRLQAQVLVKNALQNYVDTLALDPEGKAKLSDFKGLLVADLPIHRGLLPMKFIALAGRSESNAPAKAPSPSPAPVWTAYLPVKAGYLRIPGPADAPISFQPELCYVGRVKEIHDYGLLACRPAHGDIVLYRLRGRKIDRRSFPSPAMQKELHARYFKPAGPVGPVRSTRMAGPGGIAIARSLPLPVEHTVSVRLLTLENLRSQGINVTGISPRPPALFPILPH